MRVRIRSGLSGSSLSVMTFLNEVVARFPDAVSFAPGRPSDRFCQLASHIDDVGRWVRHRADATHTTQDAVWSSLAQYGPTAGVIQDLLAKHLAVDLGVTVDPSSIVVTTGCQEAMLISVLTLLDPSTDTLLVSDPSYVGITGAARLAGVPVHPVLSTVDGLRAEDVEAAVLAVRRAGRVPRALYDVPDFNNPLGSCLPVTARRELLAVAERLGVLVLEDNPYGMFAYDHPPPRTLKSLDRSGTVVYLGSFSKTLFPGLRVGYLVAEQRTDAGLPLAAAMATVKSLTTVNTAAITQALVGAALLEHDCSLDAVVSARLPHYRASRDRMLSALSRELGDAGAGVQWNRPAGGFFLVLDLPFAFGNDQLERCAAEYGVIVAPMTFFALSPGREHQVRLSFSFVEGDVIDEGIRRLARFIRDETRPEAIGLRSSLRREAACDAPAREHESAPHA